MKNERLRHQNKKQLFSRDGLQDFYLELLVNTKTSQIFKIYSLQFDNKVVNLAPKLILKVAKSFD